MNPVLIFAELSPQVQESIKFVAAAAVGGVVGNRADTWFMSLFYHQKVRLLNWIKKWNPQKEDIECIEADEKIKLLFSHIVKEISNEADDNKFMLWPKITDSIIRKKEIELDLKQHYLTLFKRLDSFAIQYLANLYFEGSMDIDGIFNNSSELPDVGDKKHIYCIGQLQCATTGLTTLSNSQPTKIKITKFGKQFIDFVSNESNDLLMKLGKREVTAN